MKFQKLYDNTFSIDNPKMTLFHDSDDIIWLNLQMTSLCLMTTLWLLLNNSLPNDNSFLQVTEMTPSFDSLRWFPQIIPSDVSNKWLLQMTPSDDSFRWLPQMTPLDDSLRWLPQMNPSDDTLKTLSDDSFAIIKNQSIICSLEDHLLQQFNWFFG